MEIAIFGGSSEIARDLALNMGHKYPKFNLFLYTRDPEWLKIWLFENYHGENIRSRGYLQFGRLKKKAYDLIINFVGAGDPAKIKILGSSILDITSYYDSIALEYLRKVNKCKYIFISSGAVYGHNFIDPVQFDSESIFKVTDLDVNDYYSLAKIYAEYKHRALNNLKITDLRIFNYFSHTQDLNSSFLISEILTALISGEKFITSTESIIRDYISPCDFFQMIEKIVFNNDKNIALDCYSAHPVEKFELLKKLQEKYSFKYEVFESILEGSHSRKKNYYSLNRIASNIGYVPPKSSLSNILEQTELLLNIRKKLV